MGTDLGIHKMNRVIEQRRSFLADAANAAAFSYRYRASKARARRILGDQYNSFVDALPEVTNGEIVAIFEALPNDPENDELLQNWLRAIADVNRLARDRRPETAAAMSIERLAFAAYLAGPEGK